MERLWIPVLLLSVLLALAGCGGGSGSSGTFNATTSNASAAVSDTSTAAMSSTGNPLATPTPGGDETPGPSPMPTPGVGPTPTPTPKPGTANIRISMPLAGANKSGAKIARDTGGTVVPEPVTSYVVDILDPNVGNYHQEQPKGDPQTFTDVPLVNGAPLTLTLKADTTAVGQFGTGISTTDGQTLPLTNPAWTALLPPSLIDQLIPPILNDGQDQQLVLQKKGFASQANVGTLTINLVDDPSAATLTFTVTEAQKALLPIGSTTLSLNGGASTSANVTLAKQDAAPPAPTTALASISLAGASTISWLSTINEFFVTTAASVEEYSSAAVHLSSTDTSGQATALGGGTGDQNGNPFFALTGNGDAMCGLRLAPPAPPQTFPLSFDTGDMSYYSPTNKFWFSGTVLRQTNPAGIVEQTVTLPGGRTPTHLTALPERNMLFVVANDDTAWFVCFDFPDLPVFQLAGYQGSGIAAVSHDQNKNEALIVSAGNVQSVDLATGAINWTQAAGAATLGATRIAGLDGQTLVITNSELGAEIKRYLNQ